jgi:CheY-specific phosphatase CheX
VQGVILYSGLQADAIDCEWLRAFRTRYDLEAPLMAVTLDPSPAARAKLLAAGVAVACDATTSPEVILGELSDKNNGGPAIEGISPGLLAPFIEATLDTLEGFARVTAKVPVMYRRRGYRIMGDYSVLMSLSAKTRGVFVLSFPRATSVGLGHRILASMDVAECNEDLIQACLAELINIITGKAKGVLADTEYGFAMGIPTITCGTHHGICNKSGLSCLGASFAGETGDFFLQICTDFPNPA